MKKTGKKLLSVVLAVLISVISSIPIFMFAVNAQSSPDAADSESGKFCLVAESDEELIIEPEWVSYGKDDTVCDALTQTSHTFDGINSGFIYSIDGVIFSPIMRTSDNGVYEFEKKASEIAKLQHHSSHICGRNDFRCFVKRHDSGVQRRNV